jgi:hypothetical protein
MNLIVNRIEDLATTIDYRLLGGRGATAVWFDYLHDYDSKQHRFSNIVMKNSRHPWIDRFSRRFRIKNLPDREHYIDPQWRPISVAEIERITGGPVELYPKLAYTESTIEEWKKGAGEMVDVAHDPTRIRKFLDSIALIEDVAPTEPYAAIAPNACIVLADEITMRSDDLDRRHWDDGTDPDWSKQVRDRPRLFAARLVRTNLTQRDKERIARYPDNSTWPWSPEEFSRRTRLLAQLRSWAVDIGELGDRPDPGLCAAVECSLDVLHYWISAVNQDFVDEDYPDRRVCGAFEVAGDYDHWYLRSIHWQQGAEETTIHRKLRTKFGQECRGHIRFGKDPWRRLVAFDQGNKRACGSARFAVDWPQRPPVDGIPDEAYIVAAEHGAGDRPVYIELPDRRLDLLPRPPDSWSEWNFGYGGTGPGHLKWAISRTFELVDGIDRDHFPEDWVERQVYHSDKAHFRISVREIRARYKPSA